MCVLCGLCELCDTYTLSVWTIGASPAVVALSPSQQSHLQHASAVRGPPELHCNRTQPTYTVRFRDTNVFMYLLSASVAFVCCILIVCLSFYLPICAPFEPFLSLSFDYALATGPEQPKSAVVGNDVAVADGQRTESGKNVNSFIADNSFSSNYKIPIRSLIAAYFCGFRVVCLGMGRELLRVFLFLMQ